MSKCKVIGFINNKGGVGKTTDSTNFAYCLAKDFNCKVLFIDFDGQLNASTSFGITKVDSNSKEYTIVELLRNTAEKRELPEKEKYIIKNDNFGVDVITCNRNYQDLHGVFEKIVSKSVFKKFLKKSGLLDDYDYIVIDNNPSFNIINKNSIVASDLIIIPIGLDYFSSSGSFDLLNEIRDIIEDEDCDTNVQIGGVIISRCKENSVSRSYKQKFFDSGVPVFESIIPENIDVGKAQDKLSLVCIEYPKSKSSIAFHEFTKEFMEEFGGN